MSTKRKAYVPTPPAKEPEMSEQPESPYSKFFWILTSAAIGGLAATFAFGAGLWAKFERMDERIQSITASVAKLETTLSDGTRMRYTSEDASRDRAAVLSLVTATGERITAVADRVTTNERRMAEMSERLVRIESGRKGE